MKSSRTAEPTCASDRYAGRDACRLPARMSSPVHDRLAEPGVGRGPRRVLHRGQHGLEVYVQVSAGPDRSRCGRGAPFLLDLCRS